MGNRDIFNEPFLQYGGSDIGSCFRSEQYNCVCGFVPSPPEQAGVGPLFCHKCHRLGADGGGAGNRSRLV